MSAPRWHDRLVPELAALLATAEWDRLERQKDGTIHCLAASGDDGGGRWYRLDPVARSLTATDPLIDPELPELQAAVADARLRGEQVRLLASRPGRRAILLAEGPAGRRLVKVYRKDRQVQARWQAIPPSPDGVWRTPPVRAWDARRRILELEHCPGRSLHDLWRAGGIDPAHGALLAAVLDWLRGVAPPADLPRHGIEDEVTVLVDRLTVFEALLARPPVAARAVVDEVSAALREGDSAEPVLVHRDLHDKQVLWDGARGTLLDLDLLARGPAALDAGNLLAHLQLRALQGLGGDWRRTAEAVAADACAAGIAADLPRWTAATLARLALLYALRSHPEGLVEALLVAAGEALGRRGDWGWLP